MKNLRLLKDLVKHMSRENEISAQILLRNYMLERLFLKRYLQVIFYIVTGLDIRKHIVMLMTYRGAK
jgi:hypothetical protein